MCITFALVGMLSQHQDIACFLTTSSIPKAASNEWTDLDQSGEQVEPFGLKVICWYLVDLP